VILGILIVIDEHALPLFFPPLARREPLAAPLDVAGQRERGAPHIVEAPFPLNTHE